MSGQSREPAKDKEREAQDLEEVAEVDVELSGRPDLAVAAQAVAQELRDEEDYLKKKGEGQAADAGR